MQSTTKLLLGSILTISSVTHIFHVHADAFGTNTTDTGPFADSALHTYCDAGLISTSVDNAASAMAYLDSATDMSDSSEACQASTDVWFDSTNLPSPTRGQNTCVTLNGSVCTSADVLVDENQIDSDEGSFDHNLNKTLRHEVGHSVGLSHYAGTAENPEESPVAGTDDSMIGGGVDDDGLWITYTQHHRDHINNAY